MKFFEEKKDNIFKILSQSISEGIVIVNENQIIVASNAATENMFGYKGGELVNQSLNILIPMEYHHSHHKQVSEFLYNTNSRQMGHGRDLYGRRKDGTTFPVEAGLNPFEINDVRYVMALVTDISVRKKQELEVITLNSELEQRIQERTEELQKSILNLQGEVAKRKEAENKIIESLRKERELNDLKTKFLSLVSHEFKTPLSGILTSATLLKKYTEANQQPQREKHVDTITNKVKFLNNILSDFLSVERLETGKETYKFNTFPLSKVLNEVVYNANMNLKEGQKINYPSNVDEIVVCFDEKILELSITNLLNNAIKYSPEHKTIDISVQSNPGNLCIKIVDQGIGIPEKEQKFIFNRYFRAENALLNQGTGIGLNIVYSHLKNLEGSVEFESVENQGSTFTICIPNLVTK